MAKAAPAPPLRDPTLLTALKVVGKTADPLRDQLVVGTHAIDLTVRVTGQLIVNPDSQYSSSSAPDTAAVVALLLAKLEPAARTRLLRELPEKFAASGGALPPSESVLLGQAEALLQALRRKVPQTRRGAVNGDLEVTIVGPATKQRARAG